MQSLPPKPEFAAAQTSDDRRASGGRSPPDRYVPRDDRRDQRSYRPRDQPRPRSPRHSTDTGSPPPRGSSPHPLQRDSWVSGSPARHHHARDYRGSEDLRARDDRDRRHMRDRRGSGRTDHWAPDDDRSRGSDRRTQDHDYRRGPPRRRPFHKDDWRDHDRERDDRRYDRRHPSPGYRRDSRSPPPRRDHYSGRGHSPVRRHSPPRGHCSPSPHHAKPDSASEQETPRHDRDRMRERRSISPPRRRRYSRSPSPHRRPPRPRSPSPSRLGQSPRRQRSPSPARQTKREPMDEPEVPEERRPSPLPRVKIEDEREGNEQGLSPQRHETKDESPAEATHAKKQSQSPPPQARTRSFSPTASEKEREREREKEKEVEKKPTQPYLPVIRRYRPWPTFSKLVLGSDHDRLDAYRVHVATEQCKTGKAWRRALHELDLATLELKTAQNRRELAESLRKRAHAGVLGIDAATTHGDTASV